MMFSRNAALKGDLEGEWRLRFVLEVYKLFTFKLTKCLEAMLKKEMFFTVVYKRRLIVPFRIVTDQGVYKINSSPDSEKGGKVRRQ